MRKVCVNGISCRAVAGMIGRPQKKTPKKSQQVKLCCAEFHSGGSRAAAAWRHVYGTFLKRRNSK